MRRSEREPALPREVAEPRPRAAADDAPLVGETPDARVAPRARVVLHAGAIRWLMPPLLLAATGAGVAFVRNGPDVVFAIAGGTLLAIVMLWILVSAFFPARADRTCPECGAEGLQRLDPRSTHGTRCRSCGAVDETGSSFLLAEEEGPLESIVLRERGRRSAPPTERVG